MKRESKAGTTCWLRAHHWVGELAVEGDFLRTRNGSCYRILEVREGTGAGGVVANFKVERLDREAVEFGEPGVFEWRWNRR